MHELKIYREVVSWQWRMIQKLKMNWHVVLKLTWGTSQILTQALKANNCVLTGSLWPRYMLFELQKYRSYLSWHRKVMQILKKDWFVVWRLKKSGKFSPEHLKVSKLGLWWDTFDQCRRGMTLKFTEELCAMTMKNNAKFEEKLTCHFKTDMRNLTNFGSSTWKS